NWKPSLVDIARFKQVPVGHEHGGWLKRDEIMPVIMDAFMGELVDSSAAAPGPAMGFIVAPYCFVFFAFCISCRCECWIWFSRWVDLNGGFAAVLCVDGTAGLDMSVSEEFVSKLLADASEQMADGRRLWCAMQLVPLDLTDAHDDRPSLLDLCRYLELDVGGKDKDYIVDVLSDRLCSQAGCVGGFGFQAEVLII
ncbi:MAG: hypothetical protein OIF58_00510, partial [Cohaesibacter sp.]|nr:hypothetical protein [Cohaesibacter sp.]